MIDSALQNEPMHQFSLNLCAAIKKHECLYDHKALVLKNIPPECEAAWGVVAEECAESVENCIWRWKNMRKSFQRTLRKGNKKYYLHKHMEYMIPHLLGSEYEPDDKTSEEAKADIKLSNTDESVQEKKNEEITTDLTLTNTDPILVEEGGNKNIAANKNIDKDEKKSNGFDSDTTSADESHIAKTNQVGEFVIKEIDEIPSCVNGNEGDGKRIEVQVNEDEVSVNEDGINSNNVSLINEDDMESGENISRRSRYRRACKRGLDAEIVSELTTEKQDEKRPRRLGERRKTLAGIALEEFNKRKSLPNLSTKKSEAKVQKTKSNKNANLKAKALEQKAMNVEDGNTSQDIYNPVNQVISTKTAIPAIVAITESTTNVTEAEQNTEQIMPITDNVETPAKTLYQHTFNQMTNYKKPLMIDTSTMTDFEIRNSSSCQFELQQNSLDFDDTFINSLKPELQRMNGRQKMNFKRKVFLSLMEVFDDASDFPNTNEYIQLISSGNSRSDTTTDGELYLMRELVSLVRAAKTTPEIMNTTEKEIASAYPIFEKPVLEKPKTATTNPVLEKPEARTTNPVLEKPECVTNKPELEIPSTSQNSKATPLPSSSHTLISPTPDLDDIVTELINEDDTQLPGSLGDILSKCDDDDVLGLPRRIIHKVVKISGPSSSTIVTGEGAKKRVYRIYPKTVNSTEPNRSGLPKNGGNTGTFYLNPSKGNVTTTQINQHKASKPNFNNPAITFRTVQKIPNNSLYTPTSSNSQNKIQPIYTSLNKTPTFPKTTPTQILDHTTGLLTFSTPPNVSKTPITTNNKTPNNPTLPSSSSNFHSNNAPQRIILRAQGGIPGLMQRRYSICGTAPLRSSPVSVVQSPLSKSIMQKSTMSSNSALSQIQISKPVSLNANAANLQTKNQNFKPIIINTNNPFSNKTSSSTVTSNTPPSTANLNNKVFEKSTFNPSPPSSNSTNLLIKQSSSNPPQQNQETRTADAPQQPRQIPVYETAGTIEADMFADPLFVKSFIKIEPLD